ncbi:hypothetical protein O7626_27030 [Micromonospora sp. WMMD1102]|uniref:hypothetical protein n=1 Tax=Micromonospora sp. WMMD1102 TaxID=3016105 RepID=UPI002414EAAA|nr:hypothetical protein [Micromonospora sp. WMMD1102]MDG4789533.1 hypothetical protein [Micromonospora sp. WMMD1102]
MRHQEQQTDNGGTDVIRSEPVPVTGPAEPDGRQRNRYPEGTGDQGPDALDERGSYDSDLATDGTGPAFPSDPAAEARSRDDRRGENRSAEDRAEDAALDDDALPERSPALRADGADDAVPSAGDRGDLADVSQTDAADGTDEPTGKVPATADADTVRVDHVADVRTAGKDAAGDPDGSIRTDDPDDPARTDDPDGSARTDDSADDARDRSGTSEFHAPAPLPTSFGAPTVGGAVAAAALAGSHRDPRNEDTVRSGDGPADDRIDGVRDERTEVTAGSGVPDRSLGAADAATANRPGAPVTDADGPEPAADPLGRPVDSTAVGVAHPVNPDVLSAGHPDVVGGDPDEPAEVDDGTAAEPRGTTDGGLPPGAAPAEPIVAILDDEAVRGFRDRWRDVQLRFVDDPPGATEEAHRLVRESVAAVTEALTRQQDDLGGWQRDDATDTEQLRMVVRRHRDFLDRLLGR